MLPPFLTSCSLFPPLFLHTILSSLPFDAFALLHIQSLGHSLCRSGFISKNITSLPFSERNMRNISGGWGLASPASPATGLTDTELSTSHFFTCTLYWTINCTGSILQCVLPAEMSSNWVKISWFCGSQWWTSPMSCPFKDPSVPVTVILVLLGYVNCCVIRALWIGSGRIVNLFGLVGSRGYYIASWIRRRSWTV
jgi:hypothetical protein